MTDSKPKKRRRIVLPEKYNQADPAETVVVPTINTLMNDALAIIGSELAVYRSKSSRGVTLDLKEARVIANYLDTLTRASKESREQARAEDLADLTDEELVQLAAQLGKVPEVKKVKQDEQLQESEISSDEQEEE